MTRDQNISVWDIWIRLFHWSFAGSVIFMLVSGLTGYKFFDWHRPVGEFVMLLVCFRLVWGFIGSSNARLLSYIGNPMQALSHLGDLLRRKPHQERGHNAAGGWAVLAMLLLIAVQAITGFMIADEEEWVEGFFYGSVSSSTSDLMYRIHHWNADLIKLVVGLHIAMILIYTLYAKQNLVGPMLSGRMQWKSESRLPELTLRHWSVGLLLLAILGAVFTWYLGWSG